MKFFKEKNLFQVIYEGKEGYVIIDKTEITNIKDHYGKYHLEKSNIINQFPDYLTDLDECKIIIASTFPLGDLPQFIVEEDFNTLNDDIDILRNFDYPNLKYVCPMTHRIWFTENFNGWCDNVNAISEMYLIPKTQNETIKTN